jgi:ribonuclease G
MMFSFFRRKKSGSRTELIINAEMLERRVALTRGGKLDDFKVEYRTEERIVGSVYKGVIQNLEDGLQAAFVDIGLKKNAFIHYWDMFPEDVTRLEALEFPSSSSKVKPPPISKRHQYTKEEISRFYPVNSEIIVQVSKGPIGTKGPRVTASISIPSRYFVLMPGSKLRGISRKIEEEKERRQLKKIMSRLPVPEGCGLILRTAGADVRGSQLVRDMRSLLEVWRVIQDGIRNKRPPACLYKEPDLIERTIRDVVTEDIDGIVIDNIEEYERVKNILSRISRRYKGKLKHYDGVKPIFEHYDIESQIENAFKRKVLLKSGGYLIFDETEAMITIDVNTGQHKGAASQEETILQVNLEAVEEITRHLKLRNIGGLIVVDFIDMRQRKNRNHVYQAMKDALRNDKARSNILPISQLGLMEMTRQRTDESMESSIYTDCPYCKGTGSVKSALTMSIEIQRQLQVILRKLSASGNVPPPPLRITVHPSLLNRLREEDEELLIRLQERFHGQLTFRADPSVHMEDMSIINVNTNDVLYATYNNVK